MSNIIQLQNNVMTWPDLLDSVFSAKDCDRLKELCRNGARSNLFILPTPALAEFYGPSFKGRVQFVKSWADFQQSPSDAAGTTSTTN